MGDDERDERILFLLRIWSRLDAGGLVWPGVKAWVERQLNELLPSKEAAE